MSFRDIKNKARTDLHGHMKVRALYLATPQSEPVECYVRVHTSFKALGDMKGTSLGSAERFDDTPRLIFWRAEIASPAQSAYVMISPTEGYRLGAIQPPDGLTISALVTKLTPTQMSGLPSPE